MIIDKETKDAATFTVSLVMENIKKDPSETNILANLISLFTAGAKWGASKEEAKQILSRY